MEVSLYALIEGEVFLLSQCLVHISQHGKPGIGEAKTQDLKLDRIVILGLVDDYLFDPSISSALEDFQCQVSDGKGILIGNRLLSRQIIVRLTILS